jgi:hypothetical protein
MGAPKGHPPYNKNGEGGRPGRNIDKLADELIEWAQLDTSTNLNGFCCSRKPPIAPTTTCEYAITHKRFGEAMKIAKCFLAERREQKLSEGKLHQKAYDLNAAVYDYYHKQEKRDQMKFESDLKVEQNAAYTPSQETLINNVFARTEQARQDHNQSSALSTPDSSINSDSKS